MESQKLNQETLTLSPTPQALQSVFVFFFPEQLLLVGFLELGAPDLATGNQMIHRVLSFSAYLSVQSLNFQPIYTCLSVNSGQEKEFT